jgi:hypothetical protein
MARFDAIGAVSAALKTLLEAAAQQDQALLGGAVDVPVVAPAALAGAVQQNTRAIAIWLYRVSPNPNRRQVAQPRVPDQPKRLPGTAVDLHYLLVARASDATSQQRLLGWAIRELEDHPSIPAAVLNTGAFVDCFRSDEAVETTLEPLTGQEENDIWQVVQSARLPAAAYLARMVVLDSRRELLEAGPVVERDLQFVGVS